MKRVSRTIHIFPAALILLGIIACVASNFLVGASSDFTGLLLLISLVTLLLGGLLGFLFGIPKLNKAYDPGENHNKNTKYHPNTNLEEISDWLTKIIIGIGLTQLIRIPEYLRRLADNILSRVDCNQMNCDFAQPVLIAVILYSMIAGFIIGYFYTRLYLPNLLELMEENRVKDAEIAIWRSGAKRAIAERDSSMEKDIPSSILSEEERAILKMVKLKDKALPPVSTLTPTQQAAINTLIAKGIVRWERDDPKQREPVPRVIDPDLLDHLIQ